MAETDNLQEEKPDKQGIPWLHLLLFILTISTTTLAGAEWTSGKSLFFSEEQISWQRISQGFTFSIPFLLILTCHEMGHYLFSRYYGVKATLPYYIPAYFGFIPGLAALPSIGTFGAFIRIKAAPKTTAQFFDIGLAGPVAGFIVALACLIYGYSTLPNADYIYGIHPEFKQWGKAYPLFAYQEANLKLGSNLLMTWLGEWIAIPERLPNAYELMHYPWLFAGYLSLIFTSLNLVPVGQLDGGHVLYGILGYKRSYYVMPWVYKALLLYTGLDAVEFMPIGGQEFYAGLMNNLVILAGYYLVFRRQYTDNKDILASALGIFALQYILKALFPTIEGAGSYYVFILFVGIFLGVKHPPALFEHKLDTKRLIWALVALVIFIISFTPQPFQIVAQTTP